MILELPYPPSNNRYYRHFHGRTCLSKEGRNYRLAVLVARPRTGWPVLGPVRVTIDVFPPTRWGQDIDSYAKALLDGLQFAKIVANDREVSELHTFRREKREIPGMTVRIESLREPESVG